MTIHVYCSLGDELAMWTSEPFTFLQFYGQVFIGRSVPFQMMCSDRQSIVQSIEPVWNATPCPSSLGSTTESCLRSVAFESASILEFV